MTGLSADFALISYAASCFRTVTDNCWLLIVRSSAALIRGTEHTVNASSRTSYPRRTLISLQRTSRSCSGYCLRFFSPTRTVVQQYACSQDNGSNAHHLHRRKQLIAFFRWWDQRQPDGKQCRGKSYDCK